MNDGEELNRQRFDDFAPTFRGRRVPHAPNLTGDMVHQIGFMIADKKAGPFKLEVDWIAADRNVGSDP